jgi:hypothetical protein
MDFTWFSELIRSSAADNLSSATFQRGGIGFSIELLAR